MNSIEVKSGRRKFVCTTKDKIMDNGNCYQLVTKKISRTLLLADPDTFKNRIQAIIKVGSSFRTV